MFDPNNNAADQERTILRKLRVWIAALAVACLLAGIGIGAMLSGKSTVAQSEIQIARAPIVRRCLFIVRPDPRRQPELLHRLRNLPARQQHQPEIVSRRSLISAELELPEGTIQFSQHAIRKPEIVVSSRHRWVQLRCTFTMNDGLLKLSALQIARA